MNQPYASPWKRLGAVLIDSIIMLVGGGLLGVLIGSMASPESWHDPRFESRLNGIGYLLAWLYYALSESSSSQGTLGKKILGLRVVALNGQSISFWRATGRFFGRIISVIPLCAGFIMAFFTQKRQTLHDMMAGCLVIDTSGSAVVLPARPFERHPSQSFGDTRQHKVEPASGAISSSVPISTVASTHPSPQSTPDMVGENAIYATVANELETGQTDKGLWTRLYVENDGDEKKTKLAYIKQRAAKLMAAESLRIQEEQRQQSLALEAAESERLRLMSITDRFNKKKSQGLLPSLEKYNFLSLVRRGELERVEQALAEEDILLLLTDSEGNTALHLAIYERNMRMIAALVKAGAPSLTRNSCGKSPVDLVRDDPGLSDFFRELGVDV